MTTRERTLGGTVGAMMGIFVLYAIVDGVFLSPAAEADKAVLRIEKEIAGHKDIISRKDYYAKHLRALKDRTFGKDRSTVKEEMRASILAMARKSGINTELKWSTSVYTGKRWRGVYQEVGWTVKARGPLNSVVNFQHLLEGDPRLTGVEALSVTPIPGHSDRQISLRYKSVVLLDPKVIPKANPSTTAPASRLVYPQLASAQRKQYDSIVQRDMFRPYVKRPRVIRRPPPPPRKRVDPPPPPPPPPRKPPIETRLKIVSLAQFGRPEVCLVHLDTEKITRYAEGDDLLDWQIAMVDYRPLPHPENPRILSSSRAIVKVGTTYWAVELGQTLSRKHRLGPDQLPEKLQAPPVVVPPGNKVSASADNG